jgi:DNA-binding transcriptional LysR family regulator
MAKSQITVATVTTEPPAPPLAWIEAFVQVVDAGGFSEAARRLGLPKSSVSRAVAKLEHALGAVLLQRTTRSLAITPEGELYLARARSALTILADARSELTECDSEPRGLVRFTAPADSGASMVTPALARFAARHPRVHVECVFTQRRVDLVAEGVDLALRAGVVDDATLVGRRLGSSERGVYAAPVYLAAHGRPRRVSELADHACVLFGGARGRARWQLQGPRGEEQVEVHGPLNVNEVGVMHQLTLLGTGIALLPITFARRDEQAGRLVRLFPRLSARGGAVYLVHPASSHVPRRVAALRDHLYAELRPYFSGEA